ncbi:hypothetical protein H2204_012283 [Knufia peltigerae]|uniref:Cytochrome P450 n=1 Tax=Knufia peltigerae TaxID=1002370 RepID=A0AA39CT54_9EURO|nr:hypothetical protein H2204_012283 [Knufia peltigerae]
MLVIVATGLLAAVFFWQVSTLKKSVVHESQILEALLTPKQIFSKVLFSPLRKIPGPFIAKITSKWLTMVDMAGDRTSAIHKLHQKYGSTVRIGPREISYSNAEVINEIYSQQTPYMKAPIYETFSLPPIGIFSLRDKTEHSQRRRLLSHAFSQASLLGTEPLIKDLVGKLIAHIERGRGRPLDALLLFRLVSFDIVGELFLGQSFGGLDLDAPKPPQFLKDMDYQFILSGLEANLPGLHWILALLRTRIPSVDHFLGARHRIHEYGEYAFNQYIEQHGRNSGRKDLLTKILTTKSNDSTTMMMTDRETCAEVGNMVFAGTDTTSTTLTYLFYELARNPSWQTRLRTELARIPHDSLDGQLPNYTSLSDLPILDAVINEALRLHPAAPASLQRVVPPGGKVLNGTFVPEGTVVSAQCYTTQRDPVAFPDPEMFLPSRWMDTDLEKKTKEPSVTSLFMPFSHGTRACIGKNLAMMELKLITASVVRRFKVEIAPGNTEDSMLMKDHFLAIPKSGKCDLIFRDVSDYQL